METQRGLSRNMKKKIMIALVLVASASLFTVSAANKSKNKAKNKKSVSPVVVLASASDSLSYAAGMKASHQGLIPYIQQAYQVDTAYMSDFMRGYSEAFQRGNAPADVAYAAGVLIAKMSKERILPATKQEFKSTNDSIVSDLFNQGFLATLSNDTTFFTPAKASEYTNDVLMGEGKRWLAENAKKEGVKITPSGLQYKVLKEGHGEVPKSSDEVEVIYEGRLLDGTVFDATSKHHGAKTDKFNAGRLIKGWTEALTMMPVGSKWEIYIPQDLAYGSRGAGQIPPYSTLVFDLELVSIVKPEVQESKPATEVSEKPAATKKVVPAKKLTPAKKAVAKRRK